MTTSSTTLVERALAALDKMKARLDQVEHDRTEPVAIIGVACRFPGGAETPERFFQLLLDGADAIVEVPASRWTPGPEAKATRWGGFLREQVDLFDAAYFGIAPREADWLDPQQRLLLEVASEALERAGLPSEKLVGSRTAVFVGCMSGDYAELGQGLDPAAWDAYTATGANHCFPAGRLSYTFGLEGPASVVDTACSSSLVALHLAVRSLRERESGLALVGGVNLMLTPTAAELGSRLGALAPDGRCKSFDARANGYVRGEGCGVLVLKRLSDAQRDGDAVLAVVRGTAVNQDGRSAGLTAPNGAAQTRLLQEAWKDAGCSPSHVGYVEAHGTGTALGDPVEVGAVAAALGGPRADGSRCVLGSVKANIGHLEAAAGLAGVIKAAMALQREVIPGNSALGVLNPRLPLDGSPLVVPKTSTAWPRTTTPRVAGVSSFGLSGTNAHVVLGEAPPRPPRSPDDGPQLVVVSARTPEALSVAALALANYLETDVSLRDVAYTALARRSQRASRVALAGDRGALVAALRGPLEIATAGAPPPVVFVFSGQGSQHEGMCRELLVEDSAFSDAFHECAAAVRAVGGPDVSALTATSAIEVVQPQLFAVQVALAAAWRALGVVPDAVVGHSMGEVAAAVVAGALSLEDGARVIVLRSALLAQVAGRGGMAVVELSASLASAELEPGLAIAVVNSPRSIVIAGEETALTRVLDRLTARGVFCRRVKVDVASHTSQVDPLLRPLVDGLAGVQPRPTVTPFWSTVTGEIEDGTSLTPDYWARNLRSTVRFADAVGGLQGAVFVELSPHPLLVGAVAESVPGALAVGSLRREAQGRVALLEALGRLYQVGRELDVDRLFPGGGEVVPLPTHPFVRRRHWLPDAPRFPRASLPVWSLRWEAQRIPTSPVGRWRVEGEQAAAFAAAIVAAGGSVADDGVLLFVPGSWRAGAAVLKLLRLLEARPVRVVLLGRGDADPTAAACAGLLRVAALERESLSVSILHVEGGLTGDVLGQVVARLGGLRAGEEVRFAPAEPDLDPESREGAVLRLVQRPLPATTSLSQFVGAWLVTGGFGGFGLAFCERLVQRGCRNLVVLSRRGPSASSAAAAVERWRALGVDVRAPAVDVADPAQVRAVVEGWPAGWPALTGVVHAAMVLDDAPLEALNAERVRTVMGPKALGAWNLHEATARLSIRAFVLCSSLAGTVGSPGQGSYAAANAFLDALARQRVAAGLPGLSIAWGAIGGVGAVARDEALAARLAARGVRAMPVEACLDALESAMAGPGGSLVVADMDWGRWARAHRPVPLLEGLVPTVPGDAVRAPEPVAPRDVEAWVLGEIGRVMRIDPRGLGEAPLTELGLDSIMAIDLRDRLRRGLGVDLAVADLLTAGSAAEVVRRVRGGVPEQPSVSKGWLACLAPRPSPGVRLFCFPYAGGSATVFQAWPEALPPQVEAWAVQAPGRGARLAEAPLRRVDAMADAIVEAMLPLLDRPFAVFGHCLGAIVVSEVLRRLSAQGHTPLHVFVSAAPAPQRYLAPAIGAAPEPVFVDALRQVGFADERVLGDPESVARLLPGVRADFEAATAYVWQPGSRLGAAVTAFCGVDDFFATRSLVAQWADIAVGPFRLIDVPGQHYFLGLARAQVVGEVGLALRHALADQGDGAGDVIVEPSRVKARSRLVVFGGFAPVTVLQVPDDVELVRYAPPGSATRPDEAPLADPHRMVARAVGCLDALPALPTRLVGLELGAFLAMGVSRHLKSPPTALVVGGAAPPRQHSLHTMQAAPIGELRALLGLSGYPVRGCGEAWLRAQTAALSSVVADDSVLSNVTVVWSPADLRLHPAAVGAWRGATRGACALVEVASPPGVEELVACALAES